MPAGDEADAFVVPARTAGADGDAQGIALFIVAKGAAGLAVRGYPTQDGARAAELTLKDTPATLIATDALPVLEHAVDAGIAAVCAEGTSTINNADQIERGYERLEERLNALGAKITRVPERPR